jgi:hypothetical protein
MPALSTTSRLLTQKLHSPTAVHPVTRLCLLTFTRLPAIITVILCSPPGLAAPPTTTASCLAAPALAALGRPSLPCIICIISMHNTAIFCRLALRPALAATACSACRCRRCCCCCCCCCGARSGASAVLGCCCCCCCLAVHMWRLCQRCHWLRVQLYFKARRQVAHTRGTWLTM